MYCVYSKVPEGSLRYDCSICGESVLWRKMEPPVHIVSGLERWILPAMQLQAPRKRVCSCQAFAPFARNVCWKVPSPTPVVDVGAGGCCRPRKSSTTKGAPSEKVNIFVEFKL